MKTSACLLVFVLLLLPVQPVFAQSPAPHNRVTLNAGQVTSAIEIESAIISATAGGTRPGTVLLDGQAGAFTFSGPDRSVNIFVSNLTLRGLNQAVIANCADGLYFDDFPLRNILIEDIAFNCQANGVVASGAFQDVTLRGNVFQAPNFGIGIQGASSGWVITANLIQAGAFGIRLSGAEQMVVRANHISGEIAVALVQGFQNQVRQNILRARWQGVLLSEETWDNLVLGNTILGVTASGIALEPGVGANRVLANRVLCAPESACLAVDALPQVRQLNIIAGNKP